MNDLLRSAIDAVYAAFKSVPKPQRIEGCPCCIEDKEVDVLLSKGLREIAPSELSAYASSVFLTVGCEYDYRYLLPRILEISALEPWWWPDIEVRICKYITYTNEKNGYIRLRSDSTPDTAKKVWPPMAAFGRASAADDRGQ